MMRYDGARGACAWQVCGSGVAAEPRFQVLPTQAEMRYEDLCAPTEDDLRPVQRAYFFTTHKCAFARFAIAIVTDPST